MARPTDSNIINIVVGGISLKSDDDKSGFVVVATVDRGAEPGSRARSQPAIRQRLVEVEHKGARTTHRRKTGSPPSLLRASVGWWVTGGSAWQGSLFGSMAETNKGRIN